MKAVTPVSLGAELGFEAMSLYKHVAGKEQILEGTLELVLSQIDIPEEGADWREAMRRRAFSARKVLIRHSWAIGLLESGTSTGPTALRYMDAILGNLLPAGFSMEHAAHAFWLLDCYLYGQVIQEVSMPFDSSEETVDTAASNTEQSMTNEFPNLAAMYEHASTGGYSFDGEFEFGLDLILEGLERRRSP